MREVGLVQFVQNITIKPFYIMTGWQYLVTPITIKRPLLRGGLVGSTNFEQNEQTMKPHVQNSLYLCNDKRNH